MSASSKNQFVEETTNVSFEAICDCGSTLLRVSGFLYIGGSLTIQCGKCRALRPIVVVDFSGNDLEV